MLSSTFGVYDPSVILHGAEVQIGGKYDPGRLVFNSPPGPSLNASVSGRLPARSPRNTLIDMSNKEKILAVIQSLPEEASIDEAIDRLYLLWKVEQGLRQADAGELKEHDTFMKELLDQEG